METPYTAGLSTPLPDSLWVATTPERTRCPALSGAQKAEVAVIGAGFMGLNVALALAEKGVSVVVIEAAQIGWGASGRNNGLLAPGLKRDPHEVRRMLGGDAGERLLRIAGDAPKVVVDLIERHAIECDLRQKGWIQAAHTSRALRVVEERVAAWAELGADIEMLDTGSLGERLGTDFYVAGSRDARGGSLNPLAYARGLATAAQRAGAKIFEQSPALEIERAGTKWNITTPGGSLSCDSVVCCTNAYNDSVRKLRGSVIPVRTAQVASAPLAASLADSILPGGESASDTLRLLTSFRLTADNRLIMGGASATAGDQHAGLFARLHHSARQRFPALGNIEWEFGWSGYLALSNNHLPKIFSVGDNYWAGIGCNGRGVAISTVVGQSIAALLCGQARQDCAIPIEPPRRIPGFGLRHAGVAAGVALNRLLDVAERRLGSGLLRK